MHYDVQNTKFVLVYYNTCYGIKIKLIKLVITTKHNNNLQQIEWNLSLTKHFSVRYTT